METSAHIAGDLAKWPTMSKMCAILRNAGLTIGVGRYSIRVQNCSHFVFQQYGGDLGDPVIDADADTVDRLIHDATLVSKALAAAKLKHRFEIYNSNNALSAYVHFAWPASPPTSLLCD